MPISLTHPGISEAQRKGLPPPNQRLNKRGAPAETERDGSVVRDGATNAEWGRESKQAATTQTHQLGQLDRQLHSDVQIEVDDREKKLQAHKYSFKSYYCDVL